MYSGAVPLQDTCPHSGAPSGPRTRRARLCEPLGAPFVNPHILSDLSCPVYLDAITPCLTSTHHDLLTGERPMATSNNTLAIPSRTLCPPPALRDESLSSGAAHMAVLWFFNRLPLPAYPAHHSGLAETQAKAPYLVGGCGHAVAGSAWESAARARRDANATLEAAQGDPGPIGAPPGSI